MIEDFVDRLGLGDEGDNPHRGFATPGAPQGLDFEDLSQEVCPASFCLAYGFGLGLYDSTSSTRPVPGSKTSVAPEWPFPVN
jgi:hypothetical protein